MTAAPHWLSTLTTSVMLLVSCGATAAEQPVAAFTAQPQRCIALNRGQMCYQRLTFMWRTAPGARYCLHQDELGDALACWTGEEQTSLALEFSSDRNVIYRIRREGQAEVLAEVMVEVAWVYQSNRKSFSRWRLF